MANTSRSVLFQGIIAICFALATGVAGAQGARSSTGRLNGAPLQARVIWSSIRAATATCG